MKKFRMVVRNQNRSYHKRCQGQIRSQTLWDNQAQQAAAMRKLATRDTQVPFKLVRMRRDSLVELQVIVA